MPTAEAPIYQFYKTDKILQGIHDKKNVFHMKTFEKDVRVLSKAVASGADIVSAKHCDPKDVVRISETTKMEKVGAGLNLTITIDI